MLQKPAHRPPQLPSQVSTWGLRPVDCASSIPSLLAARKWVQETAEIPLTRSQVWGGLKSADLLFNNLKQRKTAGQPGDVVRAEVFTSEANRPKSLVGDHLCGQECLPAPLTSRGLSSKTTSSTLWTVFGESSLFQQLFYSTPLPKASTPSTTKNMQNTASSYRNSVDPRIEKARNICNRHFSLETLGGYKQC